MLGPVLQLKTAPRIQGHFLSPRPHTQSQPPWKGDQVSLPRVDAWWKSGAWVFVEDTPALFFCRYLWGEAGQMGKASRDLPPLRTLPTFGIRQHESKMERDLA